MRSIVKKLENFEKSVNKHKKKIELNKDEFIEKGIEVPGITTNIDNLN